MVIMSQREQVRRSQDTVNQRIGRQKIEASDNFCGCGAGWLIKAVKTFIEMPNNFGKNPSTNT